MVQCFFIAELSNAACAEAETATVSRSCKEGERGLSPLKLLCGKPARLPRWEVLIS